jgi:uncharacterized protein YndB with AHSA1/START domain/predicted ester cyclase
MSATTLYLCVSLAAPRESVFQVLTDSREHSAFTGGKSEIDARKGGKFSYFDGLISGVNDDLSAPELIEQTLRAKSWPDRHFAKVHLRLEHRSDGRRTFVRIKEEGIPPEQLDAVIGGWTDYWDKLAEYLRARRLSVVQEFVERYKNKHEWDAVDEYVAPDCKIHIPIPGLPQGREGMRANGKAVCSAFPDVFVTREFIATEGDLVLERAHAKATHKGELMGIPATGKQVRWWNSTPTESTAPRSPKSGRNRIC